MTIFKQLYSAGRKCTDVALDLMRKTENGGSVEEFGLLHRLKNVCHASDEEARLHCTDFTFDISDPVKKIHTKSNDVLFIYIYLIK
jgi:hypothetical protein